MPFTYEYARPAVAVDCVVFGFDDGELKVLLIRRGLAPFKGGGRCPAGSSARTRRSTPPPAGSWPRRPGWPRSTWSSCTRSAPSTATPASGWCRSPTTPWSPWTATRPRPPPTPTPPPGSPSPTCRRWRSTTATSSRPPSTRLRGKVRYQPVGFELLPERFTLSQLQHLYEAVLERPLDKRNFRKKLLAMDVVVETDEVEQDVAHRAARLYRFDAAKYQRLAEQGFNFDL